MSDGVAAFDGTCGGASSPIGQLYAGTTVESDAASSPTQTKGRELAVVWQIDRWSSGGARGVGVSVSTNGGATWHSTALPFSQCADPASPFARVTDPWVSIGPDKTVYVSAIPVNAAQNSGGNVVLTGPGVEVMTSSNGGITWHREAVVGDGADKDAITADPRRPERAYLIWDGNAGNRIGLVMSVTTNGGVTWSQPQIVVPWSSAATTLGADVLVAPSGRTLYDVYQILAVRGTDPTQLDAWTAESVSHDLGESWSTPQRIAKQRSVGPPHSAGRFWPPVRSSIGMPAGAIDLRSGAIVLTWEDAR